MRDAFRLSIRNGGTVLWHAFVQSLKMFDRNGLQNHAAAMALYFLLSATPLLFLLAWSTQSLAEWAPESVSAGMLMAALYEQFHLAALVEMGVIPAQHNLSASGIGMATLLLSSRGLLKSVQGAMAVIFAGERRRHMVVNWLIPLLVLPMALLSLGGALVSDQLLKFFLQNSYLTAEKGLWMEALNGIFIGFIAYAMIFATYLRLPAEPPPLRPTVVFAALSLVSLWGLFSVMGLLFNLSRFQLMYGAIGGAVFILITSYTAALLFYFWPQFLRAYLEVDVRALERLIIADESAKAGDLTGIPGFERLIHRYGREFSAGAVLVQEGDIHDKSTLFICSGTVRLSRKDNNLAQDHVLAELGTGALFGEMAYLLGEGRTASATAVTPVLVLVLPPEILEALMTQSTRVARDIIQSLCARLERMNEAATTGNTRLASAKSMEGLSA